MKQFFTIAVLFGTLLIGCSPQATKPFYWGEYSSTLYDLKHSPDEKTLEAHRKQLLLIVEESGQKNKQVPPGVYAEYGYILLKGGNEAEGMEYLDKEAALYAESVIFIQRIKAEYARGKK